MQILPTKGDILGRRGIEILVDRFYEAVRRDGALSHVFDEVARVDWSEHPPKLCGFRETVLFRSGGYQGNPLAVHRQLPERTPMNRALFDRWPELFAATVDEHFAGGHAEHINRVAAGMANVLYSRLRPTAPPSSAGPGESNPHPYVRIPTIAE